MATSSPGLHRRRFRLSTRLPAVLGLTAMLTMFAAGCADRGPEPSGDPSDAMDRIAESYVKLVLAVGRHDPDYVDAYYGPEEWRRQAESESLELSRVPEIASPLIDELEALPAPEEEMPKLRRRYLVKQLASVVARVDLLQGASMSFDEESRALYDAVAPTRDATYFQGVLEELEELLPGEGPLVQRYDRFRSDFVIPEERLDAVFQTAIDECRTRTVRQLGLPPGESFTVEYVTDRSWSGYNWYQGDYRSLIQVNVDLPITIDRAIDLACHEGYPGHHAYNLLRERELYVERDWVETTVYPLFSPQSLIAEGSANYGIEMAFPGDERLAFEEDVLFPLAGLDPERASAYYAVRARVDELDYAHNEAARRYLDGEIDVAAAVDWLETYALMPRSRAEQRIRFIDQYRAYVINYNLGRDLVRQYVEDRADDETARWRVFGELLSSPRLPSDLR